MKKFERLSKEMKTKQCKNCGINFSKNRDCGNQIWINRKYCSTECSIIANTGHGVSAEIREKIRKSNTGKINSPETRAKMSASRMGKSPSNKGVPMSEEAKEKLSIANKGKDSSMKGNKHTEEAKEKNRLAHIGNKAWNKGIKYLAITGEKHPNWKGGISKTNKTERQLAMETIEYKFWRTSVFERDCFTCVECGEKGGKLQADHIKPWRDYKKLRYKISNGRTLCVECHKKIGWSLFKNGNPMKALSTSVDNKWAAEASSSRA